MQTSTRLFLILLFPLFFLGCQEDSVHQYAQLSVQNIQFSGELMYTFLDLPDGAYQPDNPDFHPARPETWTGNMAKYVKRIYNHTITFTVVNSAGGMAYDTEVDLHCTYTNGDTEVITVALGNIQGDFSGTYTKGNQSYNSSIQYCSAEAYWYDY